MRKQLAKQAGSLASFTATFGRYGVTKTNFYKYTLLLKAVRNDSGEIVADHVWVRLTDLFLKVGELFPGETISFRGRIKEYRKGSGRDFGIDEIREIEVEPQNLRRDYPDEEYERFLFVKELSEQFYTKQTGIERAFFQERHIPRRAPL